MKFNNTVNFILKCSNNILKCNNNIIKDIKQPKNENELFPSII